MRMLGEAKNFKLLQRSPAVGPAVLLSGLLEYISSVYGAFCTGESESDPRKLICILALFFLAVLQLSLHSVQHLGADSKPTSSTPHAPFLSGSHYKDLRPLFSVRPFLIQAEHEIAHLNLATCKGQLGWEMVQYVPLLFFPPLTPDPNLTGLPSFLLAERTTRLLFLSVPLLPHPLPHPLNLLRHRLP
jgi:hypothetical protein